MTPMNGGEGDRGFQMGARLRKTGERLGIPEDVLDLLGRAHGLAMEPRRERLPGDRHTDFLHPGRSALILMLDVELTDAGVLAATVLTESERPALRVGSERIREVLGGGGDPDEGRSGRIETLRDAVPDPAAETLAEELVVAPEAVRLTALAERLDHLRHAHLWDDGAARARVHASAVEVYAPVAERTHPALAHRYRWWTRMFARRYL